MVNWKNYEEYMLLHADGELSDPEQKALLDFVKEHPELQDELKAYESTKLVPDLSQVYVGKESLLKPAPATRVISLGSFWKYSAAAGIILVLLLIASRWLNKGAQEQVNTPEITKQEPVKPAVPMEHQPQKVEPVAAPPPATIAKNITASTVSAPIPTSQEKTIKQDKVEQIAGVSIKALAITEEVSLTHEPIAVVDVSLSGSEHESEEQRSSDFLAWLPVNEEKKEGLQNLKDNMESRIEQAKTIKDNIKDSGLAVKLGGKEFVVINF